MTYNLSPGQYTAQDDIIDSGWEALFNDGEAYTLAGNDKIIGRGSSWNQYDSRGLFNTYNSTINTGEGRDTIIAIAWSDYWGSSICNLGTIETGNDADSISTYREFYDSYGNYTAYYGEFENHGVVSLGDGNDMLDAKVNVAYDPNQPAIWNSGTIEAGNGDDIIFSNTAIYNSGFINTGNGNDTLTTGGFDSYGNVITGGFDGYGNVFLGDGEDYLRGFGSGYYDGGNDQDSLQLTSGYYYTIGIGGADVSFTGTRDNKAIVMQTSGFEKLIANGTTYDFTSLYDGMTIYVW